MARILLSAAPWTYREVRFADGQDPTRQFLSTHFFKRESTINGKMPFWSLLYLAAWLEREGHEVKYLESYGIDDAAWFREVHAFDPHIVGLNASPEVARRMFSAVGAEKEGRGYRDVAKLPAPPPPQQQQPPPRGGREMNACG